jgi:predicted kinase
MLRKVVPLILAVAGLLLVLRYITRRRPKALDDKPRKKRKPLTESDDPTLPKFMMLVGVPGSGKSTWAEKFVFRCDASFTIVSSDAIRKQVTGSVNDQSRNVEVWDVILNQCQGLLANGRNVILDATNTNTEKRRQFVKQLPRCQRLLKTFAINKSIAKSRIARDVQCGVDRADVPDAVIDVMYRQFQDSLVSLRDEDWQVR